MSKRANRMIEEQAVEEQGAGAVAVADEEPQEVGAELSTGTPDLADVTFCAGELVTAALEAVESPFPVGAPESELALQRELSHQLQVLLDHEQRAAPARALLLKTGMSIDDLSVLGQAFGLGAPGNTRLMASIKACAAQRPPLAAILLDPALIARGRRARHLERIEVRVVDAERAVAAAQLELDRRRADLAAAPDDAAFAAWQAAASGASQAAARAAKAENETAGLRDGELPMPGGPPADPAFIARRERANKLRRELRLKGLAIGDAASTARAAAARARGTLNVELARTAADEASAAADAIAATQREITKMGKELAELRA